ncbi:MAG TPA: HAD-IA family hydrolase [Bryobacteraceae bacterium]|nr:HAD-IA family hydrolase [Bryobacteraceae bacterium]
MNERSSGIALLFDLDGVILDSMPLHTEAWEVYLKRFGKWVPDLEKRMHGARNDQIVSAFLGGSLTQEEIFEHGAAKERLFRELMAPRLEEHIVPGVREFLAEFADLPKAIASNAEPANIDFVLDGAGLRRFFPVVVDGHQVARAKPFPDIYLRAAELVQTPPARCIVFEDSPTGVEAGRGAGMRVAGIGTHQGALPGVEIMAADFRDPKLVEWLRELEA